MKKLFFLCLSVLTIFFACKQSDSSQKNPTSNVQSPKSDANRVPDWAKSATIYELNVRVFSKEGTLTKATEGLQHIKDLGIDILWLMPIYPICETNKKCNEKLKTECLGSSYAAYDFKAVNPSYGTDADLKTFIGKAHALGIKVILDFVPDHTGWDSKWMKEHLEYFKKVNGKFTTPIDPKTHIATDWTDVAMLDYDNKDLRAAIIDAHEYWMNFFDVDGYREDVAGFVPNDFWADLRSHLDKIKPTFMLAENEDELNHFNVGFQMNYGWKLHGLLKDIAKGKKNADDIQAYQDTFRTKYPKQGYPMYFTQSHDENSWAGTERESFGEAYNTFEALCFTLEGMGMILSGQEVSLNKRIAFFNKDEIDWSGKSRTDYFRKLTDLKHNNKALWNGLDGGAPMRIETSAGKNVYAFHREKDGDKLVCVYNLSAKPQEVNFKVGDYSGNYKNVMQNGATYELKPDTKLKMDAWDYLILSNK